MDANGYLLEHAVLDQDWYVLNDLANWRRRRMRSEASARRSIERGLGRRRAQLARDHCGGADALILAERPDALGEETGTGVRPGGFAVGRVPDEALHFPLPAHTELGA